MSKPPAPLSSAELLRAITDEYGKQAETSHKKVLRAAAGFAMLTAGLGIGNHIATEINEPPEAETTYIIEDSNSSDQLPTPKPDEFIQQTIDKNTDPVTGITDTEDGDPYNNPPPYPVEGVDYNEYYYEPYPYTDHPQDDVYPGQ